MKAQTEVKEQISWMNRVNFGYGLLGAILLICVSASREDLKSFVAGWAIAVLNVELLKRLISVLMAAYEGRKPDGMFYFLLFGKFMFWGLLFVFFSSARWIQAIPFVMGSITILASGFAVGMRDYYARTTP